MMESVEINPTGCFANWSPLRLRELQKEGPSAALGQKLLVENDYVRIWEVILFPDERLPFRKIRGDYSLVAYTDGLLLSRCGCGEMKLLRFKQGDIAFVKHEAKEPLEDMENIGDETVILNIMEIKTLDRITDSLSIEPSK